MPVLSRFAAKLKKKYFLTKIQSHHKVLECGSGKGQVVQFLRERKVKSVTGLDINAPADIVGDIRDYKELGLEQESYDIIIAFEIVEHVDCIKQCYELLKPGGILMMTSPLPVMDPFLSFLEKLGLNQKRTSPHSNLTWFKDIGLFRKKKIIYPFFLSQWGYFVK